jgi:hypothetical protein
MKIFWLDNSFVGCKTTTRLASEGRLSFRFHGNNKSNVTIKRMGISKEVYHISLSQFSSMQEPLKQALKSRGTP